MSKTKLGLRQAGAAGTVVALTIGVAGLTAGSAFAAPGLGLSADSQPNVTQGTDNQAAGDLDYRVTNNFTTGSTVTFSLDDTCTTQAGINAAVEFSSAPSVAIKADNSTSTARIPTFTSALGSTGQCGLAGIQNTFTVTLTQPSDTNAGDATDVLDVALSNVKYNVGSTTPTGLVEVTGHESPTFTPSTGDTTADNATVVNKSFSFAPREGVQTGATGVALGTGTFTESSPNAFFAQGVPTPVTLTLSSPGTFTADQTPTVNVPAGYTATKPVTAGNMVTFSVTAPAAASAATVTITGLKANTPATAAYTITPTVGTGPSLGSVNVINAVAFDRHGGSTRYTTATSLYNSAFAPQSSEGGPGSVVLSNGQNFPDALSANYLASRIGGGTLLTPSNSLDQSARQAIINDNINTVYITGGTDVVSQAIQNQLEATHIGNNPNAAFIQVIRLAGANRYATNAAINRNNIKPSSTVIMSSSQAPYDALAAGPIVYKQQYPLILTDGKSLSHGEQGQLSDLGAQNVVITGGTDVVSAAVQDQLTALGYTVSRVSGDTRVDTAAQIATWGTTGITDATGVLHTGQGLTATTTDITDGQGFADALSDGPVAGALDHPLLLASNPTTPGAGLVTYLNGKMIGGVANGTDVDTLNALGLTDVTTNGLLQAATAAIGPVPTPVNTVVVP